VFLGGGGAHSDHWYSSSNRSTSLPGSNWCFRLVVRQSELPEVRQSLTQRHLCEEKGIQTAIVPPVHTSRRLGTSRHDESSRRTLPSASSHSKTALCPGQTGATTGRGSSPWVELSTAWNCRKCRTEAEDGKKIPPHFIPIVVHFAKVEGGRGGGRRLSPYLLGDQEEVFAMITKPLLEYTNVLWRPILQRLRRPCEPFKGLR